ncbi:MAG: hypothetical protein ACI9HY_000927, partial [Planctomycetaceae bacterium]
MKYKTIFNLKTITGKRFCNSSGILRFFLGDSEIIGLPSLLDTRCKYSTSIYI